MTTQIETTDYIHQTGGFMRSMKTIRTEAHDNWTEEALEAEHAYEVAKAEALGRIAERGDNADELADILADADDYLDSVIDMEGYQAMYQQLTEKLDATLVAQEGK